MKKLSTFLPLTFLFGAFFANAGGFSGTASGKINAITIKETGYIFVQFDQPHANTVQCSKADTVAIAVNNPNRDEFLSLSMLAYASGKTADYWVTSCHTAYGESWPLAVTTRAKTN